MKPVRTLWLAVAVALAAVVLIAPLRRGLFRLEDVRRSMGSPSAPSFAETERIGTSWGWTAMAECLHADDPHRMQAFDRAVALDPGDEVALIRRAAAALIDKQLSPAQAVADARAAVTAHSDNAYAHYLLAAALARGGNRAEGLVELRAGNAAPRFEPGVRGVAAMSARLEHRRGVNRVADLEPPYASLEELTALRDFAWRMVSAKDARIDLEVARFGGRVRDQADLYITALVGVAVQSVAFAGPETRTKAKTQVKETTRQRLERVAARFQGRLAAAGLADKAAWVDRECQQSISTHAAVAKGVKSNWPLTGPIGSTVAWALWILLLTVTAVLLLASLLPGRIRHAEPLPWRGSDLALLWAATLVPALAVAGLCVHMVFAALSPEHSAPDPRALVVFYLPLGIVVALRAGLAWLGSRFARRVSDKAAGLTYVRRSWQPVGAATAAVLLLLALATSLPLAYHRHQLAGTSCLQHERAVLDGARLGR